MTNFFAAGIDVTNKCTLRCLHCFNSSGGLKNQRMDEMSDEELERMAYDMYNIAMDIHEVLEKETQNINMLSGGEKQKVELVKTILKDADVYFFDEPTAHLDQESRDEYYQYLKKQKDKIIVVVSHNSQERQYFDVIYEV